MAKIVTKGEIKRRIAAVQEAGLTVTGLRFAPDGTMTVLTTKLAINADDDPDEIFRKWEAEELERRMQAAFSPTPANANRPRQPPRRR